MVIFNSIQDATVGKNQIVNNIAALNNQLSQVGITPVTLAATPIVTTIASTPQPLLATSSSTASPTIALIAGVVAGILVVGVGAGVGIALYLRNKNNAPNKGQDELFAKNNVTTNLKTRMLMKEHDADFVRIRLM